MDAKKSPFSHGKLAVSIMRNKLKKAEERISAYKCALKRQEKMYEDKIVVINDEYTDLLRESDQYYTRQLDELKARHFSDMKKLQAEHNQAMRSEHDQVRKELNHHISGLQTGLLKIAELSAKK